MTALRALSQRVKLSPNDAIGDFYQCDNAKHIRGKVISYWHIAIGASPIWKPEVFEAVYNLLTRTYWCRLWIMQEIIMAHNDSPILCGDVCVSWQDLYNAAQSIVLDEVAFNDNVERKSRQTGAIDLFRDCDLDRQVNSPKRTWRRIIALTKL